MILLLHNLVDLATPAADRIASLTAGTAATLTMPANLGQNLTAQWSGRDQGNKNRRIDLKTTSNRITTSFSETGHLSLSDPPSPARPVFVASVNTADEESDLRRLEETEILARFTPGTASMVKSPEELARFQHRQKVGVDLVLPAGLLLLLLLIAESAFANRFYRITKTSEPTT